MKRLAIEMDPERNSSPHGSRVERLVMSAAAAAAAATSAYVAAVTAVGVKASSSAVVIRIITLVLLRLQPRWSHSGRV